MTPIGKLLTIKELAALLRISRAASYALVQSGRLPCVRLGNRGGSIRVLESDVWEYVQRCRTSAPVEVRLRARQTLKHLQF